MISFYGFTIQINFAIFLNLAFIEKLNVFFIHI